MEKFFANQIAQLKNQMRAGDVDGIKDWIEFGDSWGSTLQAAASVARTHLEVVDGLKGQAVAPAQQEEPTEQRKPGQQQSAGRINLSRI